MQTPKLAPHEAELVEADARAAYERLRRHPVYAGLPPWPDAHESFRSVYMAAAANPYRS